MRRALIVGINHYPTAPLQGCVNDAESMEQLLLTHGNTDEDANFACELLVSSRTAVTRAKLMAAIKRLFAGEAEIALLYFSGHGVQNDLGGFLVTQDGMQHDEGVAMEDIMTLAKKAPKVQEVVILLDCCYSGQIADDAVMGNIASLRSGMSILTASAPDQPALENKGHGVFTRLVMEALQGGAADVVGNVTIASIYAYLDQTLGGWDQRPHFKAHVSKLLPIRRTQSSVAKKLLRKLPDFFAARDTHMPLNDTFEPTSPNANPKNCAVFAELQKLRAARLLEPVGEEHLYWAAMNSKACRLTELGQFYWTVAKARRI